MIELKSNGELARMRRAGDMVARVLEEMPRWIKPGVTTAALDRYAEECIVKLGGRPSFKGYRGFPSAICTSVNEEVVHGIPGPRALKVGDIIGIDVGAEVEGYHADGAMTYPVGEVSPPLRRLIEVTREALRLGIEQARLGNWLSNVSHAIQRHVEANGFQVVRQFVGHGIGSELHQDPAVPNYGAPNQGLKLQAGMALAIEPMVNMGTWEVEILPDGWTAVTKDRRPSCHFEDTVAVTPDGPELLTRCQKKSQ